MRSRRRVAAIAAVLAALGATLDPAVAGAHGIVGRADLPIPTWLFSWAAAVVLIVSFVALSALWTRPRLQREQRTPRFRLPRAVRLLANLLGVGLFVLVVYSGLAGTQVAFVNFSVTFLYVVFWVGLPVASVLFGNLFAELSPWRSTARLVRWSAVSLRGSGDRPSAPVAYPGRLGQWPAVAGLLGFAWLELVYANRDSPSTLAVLSLAYFAVMLAAMLTFGVEEWAENGDAFGTYFALLSRMSALCVDDEGRVCTRRLLSGLPSLQIRPGTIALVCTVIGTTTFDGLSNGGVWRVSEPSLQEAFSGLGGTAAQELAYTIGLLLSVLLVVGVYALGIRGVRSVSSRYGMSELADKFAHTLVPIGFAYVLAHYFSLLIWQGQAIIPLASDPLGNGANLFGTSTYQINYTVLSFAAIWYVQVAALVTGHVAGLALAHDRALVMYRRPEEAVRSQYWLLTVMVAFTSFGLWLLSAVGT